MSFTGNDSSYYYTHRHHKRILHVRRRRQAYALTPDNIANVIPASCQLSIFPTLISSGNLTSSPLTLKSHILGLCQQSVPLVTPIFGWFQILGWSIAILLYLVVMGGAVNFSSPCVSLPPIL